MLRILRYVYCISDITDVKNLLKVVDACLLCVLNFVVLSYNVLQCSAMYCIGDLAGM